MPLYYTASATPHSNRPQASTLPGYSPTDSEGGPRSRNSSPSPRLCLHLCGLLPINPCTQPPGFTEVPAHRIPVLSGSLCPLPGMPLAQAQPPSGRILRPSRQSADQSALPSEAPGSTTRRHSFPGAQLSVPPLWPSSSALSLGTYGCAVPPKVGNKPPGVGISLHLQSSAGALVEDVLQAEARSFA